MNLGLVVGIPPSSSVGFGFGLVAFVGGLQLSDSIFEGNLVSLIGVKFLCKAPESNLASIDLLTKADNSLPVFNCIFVALKLRRPCNLPGMEGAKMTLNLEANITHRVVEGII